MGDRVHPSCAVAFVRTGRKGGGGLGDPGGVLVGDPRLRQDGLGFGHMGVEGLPLTLHRGTTGERQVAVVARLRDELGVNSTCGASNFSFGLPNRNGINSAFLTMAISHGLTSAITNPMHTEVMQAVRGADVMMGRDPDCRRWIQAFREPQAEGAEGARGRRQGRRRRA